MDLRIYRKRDNRLIVYLPLAEPEEIKQYRKSFDSSKYRFEVK